MKKEEGKSVNVHSINVTALHIGYTQCVYFLSYNLLAKIPKPRDLMRLVTTNEPIKLGRELCVKDSDLDIVKKDHPNDHSEQLSDVLSLYMKQSVKPSWEEVATALWNIGEKKIAQKIADKYGM